MFLSGALLNIPRLFGSRLSGRDPEVAARVAPHSEDAVRVESQRSAAGEGDRDGSGVGKLADDLAMDDAAIAQLDRVGEGRVGAGGQQDDAAVAAATGTVPATVTIPDGAQPNQPFAIQLPGSTNPVTTPRGMVAEVIQ